MGMLTPKTAAAVSYASQIPQAPQQFVPRQQRAPQLPHEVQDVPRHPQVPKLSHEVQVQQPDIQIPEAPKTATAVSYANQIPQAPQQFVPRQPRAPQLPHEVQDVPRHPRPGSPTTVPPAPGPPPAM